LLGKAICGRNQAIASDRSTSHLYGQMLSPKPALILALPTQALLKELAMRLAGGRRAGGPLALAPPPIPTPGGLNSFWHSCELCDCQGLV